MRLEVDVRRRLGAFTLDARFTSEGGATALFGPSGAGKTTLVNLIAGLIRPAHGRISLGGETLVDTERGIFVPPHRRAVGYVFQEARLFPHLSVRRNLLYGWWFVPRSRRRTSFDHIVELLGLGLLLARRPSTLSGGEKQRVAIGRALLASPRLLLMDEPLASLEAARKGEVLPYIERLRDDGIAPIVYVTHSPAEAARIATTVVVLADGRVTAFGRPAEILARDLRVSL